MQDFEKLGVFYLGRQYDLAQRKGLDSLVLYDSKDLVTHAVCVGMTGSGKTGLCLSVLEEAAIDNIPSIVIDPKGDLSNLLLTFPQLRAEDFEPWVNAGDAMRNGLTTAAFAAQQAEAWKRGLAEWGQDGARISRLRDAADFAIYTPGSNAGLEVSVVRSFAAPEPALLENREALRDRVVTTATALLSLLGIDADPIQSREHILLSSILDNAWRAGQNLDLPALIQRIQTPPFQRVGVLDLESFYPAKERFSLAMSLNNLLASPGFEAWLEGEPLDIGAMLHTSAGKPRVSIFSIAHLSDAERMFFVALLLNQILGWMRTQTGTTSLRALVYMDEIAGYFPPVANPPSKPPLLTLLKQARAFGIGIVLATQNPVDLDYKGLSNTGTWFIGRLQTERDKARLLDGLEGAATEQGSAFSRQHIDEILAGLGSRVFLMNNVHESAPVVFESRWALSYLRGPLTRDQIRGLMDGRRAAPAEGQKPAAVLGDATAARPALAPEINQYFLALRGSKDGVAYHPAVLGIAQVHFLDDKNAVDQTRDVAFAAPITAQAVPVDWDSAAEIDLDSTDFDKEPAERAGFAEIPAAGAKPKNYDGWKKDFTNWIFANQKIELFESPSSGEVSKAGESERDFRLRLQQASREQRDQAVAEIRNRYAPKLAALEERIRRAGQALAKEKEQAGAQTINAALSIGTTLLGAFLGRKTFSQTNLRSAATAVRSVTKGYKETEDVNRAGETVQALQAQHDQLGAQLKSETDALQAKTDPAAEQFGKITVRPKKTNITLRLFGLAWAPYRKAADGKTAPAWV